jgi:hypothetical protein
MAGAMMFCSMQVSAQQLASSNRLENTFTDTAAQPSQKTLKVFLQELEAEYSIRINYASEIVLGKMVKVPLDENKGIESKLKEVLTPLGLEYEQMQEDMFFIFQKHELQKVAPQPLEGSHDKQTADAFRKVSRLKIDNSLHVKIAVQDITITGKVTDENGDPLPGVNVIIKNNNTGTTTDIDGQYRLAVAENDDVLIFSYIGYITEEISVDNRNVIDVSLVPDIQSLGEVVVTALGIARESNSLPYSTQSVKPKELTEVIDANKVVNSLQGK